MLDAVPERIKRARPWRSRVDFCRWHGADWFVLGEVSSVAMGHGYGIESCGYPVDTFFLEVDTLDLLGSSWEVKPDRQTLPASVVLSCRTWCFYVILG